jgi:hypothetical protein
MEKNNAKNPEEPEVDYSVLNNLTTDGLQQILSQLFQPDTKVVKHATALLKTYFKTV